MFCRLFSSLRWFVPLYFLYLALFACRGNYGRNSVEQYTCAQLNTYVYPYLDQHVYPLWNEHVSPHVADLDSKLGVSAKVSPIVKTYKAKVVKFDEQHQVSYQVEKKRLALQIWIQTHLSNARYVAGKHFSYQLARAQLYHKGNTAPLILYYFKLYKNFVEHAVDTSAATAKAKTEFLLSSSRKHVLRFVTYRVVPTLSSAGTLIVQNPYVVKVTEVVRLQFVITEVKRIIAIMAVKSAQVNASLQEKSDFLRSEFNNLVSIDDLKKKFTGKSSPEIIEVVKDILEDVTSSDSAATSETEDDVVDIDDAPVEESEESEEEVVTIKVTSTVTVVAETSTADDIATISQKEEKVVNFEESSSQAQIDHQLAYWETKVDKTLKLASSNLETDMKPFLDTFIEELKELISANFTRLQRDNYERYKVMNVMITDIGKDSETIQETGQIIENPTVDRQLMRDRIKEAYEAVEDMKKDVEVVMNDAHAKVLEKYFEVTQDTVDILESFAETTMLDFSSQLTALLTFLETESDFEDEMSWTAWKKFHKVKDSIFKIRDLIFNEAQEYKLNHKSQVKPKGLDAWREYLANVNFHVNFLLRDNDDYLKLVRARANVAYQLREGLTHELEVAAAAEAAAAEAEEAAKEPIVEEEESEVSEEFVDAAEEVEIQEEELTSAADPEVVAEEEESAEEEVPSEEPVVAVKEEVLSFDEDSILDLESPEESAETLEANE